MPDTCCPVERRSTKISTWTVAILSIAMGVLICVLVAIQTPYLNGPWYWKWQYLVPRHETVRWYGWMGLCAVPIVLAAILFERWKRNGTELGRGQVCLAIALLIAGSGAMKLMSSALQLSPPSLEGAGYIMSSPVKTSYYFDARVIMNERNWLSRYHEILPLTNLHTQSKPPGPVLYSAMMIRLFGSEPRGATIAAVVLGGVSLLSIPALYWLVRRLSADQWTALIAAILVSLAPGFVYMFPAFDPVWIVFAALMIGTWREAVDEESNAWAIAFGAVLAVATLFTYLVLVLGTFVLLYSILSGNEMSLGARIARLLRLAVISIGVFIALYAAMAMTTGFDPIATFRAAYANQARLLEMHSQDRPYPWTILFDLTDFMLGFGWLAVIPAIHALVRSRGYERLLFSLFLLTPLVVAAAGLIQSETARCWLFMVPLVLVPAAWEISRWTSALRLVTILVMTAITLVVGQNMMFKWPTEDVVRNAAVQPRVEGTPSVASGD